MHGTRMSFWAVICFMIATFFMQFYIIYVNHYDRFQYQHNDDLKNYNIHHLQPKAHVHEAEVSSKNDTLKDQSKIIAGDDPPKKIEARRSLTSRDLFNLVREQNKDKYDLNANGVAEALAALKSRFREKKTVSPSVKTIDKEENESGESSDAKLFNAAGKKQRKQKGLVENPILHQDINPQVFKEGKVVAKSILNDVNIMKPVKPASQRLTTVKQIQNTTTVYTPITYKPRSPLDRPNAFERRIDLHDYPYLIKPNTCLTDQGDFRRVELLLLVVSSPTNYNLRESVRRTWGMHQYPDYYKRIVETVFMLGSPDDPNVLARIKDENRIHGDILMEDFKDTYLNLTVKTVMGLKWASRYCSSTKFVMKTDDDMMINTPHLLEVLKITSWRNYIGGKVALNYPTIRDPNEKFYVPVDLYGADTYPPYVVGIGYIISIDLVHKMYVAALDVPLFPWEDVYIGMLMEKINIKAKQIEDFHKQGFHDSVGRLIKTHTMLGVLRKTSVIHDLSIFQMLEIWKVWAETL